MRWRSARSSRLSEGFFHGDSRPSRRQRHGAVGHDGGGLNRRVQHCWTAAAGNGAEGRRGEDVRPPWRGAVEAGGGALARMTGGADVDERAGFQVEPQHDHSGEGGRWRRRRPQLQPSRWRGVEPSFHHLDAPSWPAGWRPHHGRERTAPLCRCGQRGRRPRYVGERATLLRHCGQ